MAILTHKEEKDFIQAYYGCVLCKKYFQYNLWFESSGEYDNIEYCRKYVQKYLCWWINLFLLQHFGLPLIGFLYRSPYFIKFIDSGFLNYLDYTFLAAFSREAFSFDAEGKQRIRGFVKAYFECFIEEALERDLLVSVGKVLNGILLEGLREPLIKTLGSTDELLLDRQAPSKLLTGIHKEIILRVGLSFFQPFLQGGYYKAYRPIQPYSGRLMRSSYSLIRDKEMESLEAYLKPAKLIRSIMEKSLIGLLDSWNQEEAVVNQEIHSLIESSESEGEKAHIGLHKNRMAFFEADSIQEGLIPEEYLVLIAKGHKAYFKSIDNSFVDSKGKKTIDPKASIDCEIDFLSIEETQSLILEDQEESVIEQNTLSDIDASDDNKEDKDFLFWAFYKDTFTKTRKTKTRKATIEYFLV